MRPIAANADKPNGRQSSTLPHPVHPVHPVEKSGFDPMVRIVANMIDPDRYQPNHFLASWLPASTIWSSGTL
jgi:hypothetical protein